MKPAEAGARQWNCLLMKNMDAVEDGKIEVIGKDVDSLKPGSKLPLAILVEVAGKKMEQDFEPILERQIHHLLNYAQGVMHIGQRDIAWVRISKQAVDKGFKLSHIGKILHAKFHQDFGSIVDKVQVKIITDEDKVDQALEEAREILQAARRASGGSDRRAGGDFLFMHALPELCAQPCLHCHAGAARPLRRL